MTRRVLALAAILILGACSGGPARLPSAPSPAANSGDPVACRAAGGQIRPVCRLRRPMCVKPFPDAGNRCTDDAQCQGGCLYEGAPVAEDGTTTGLCRQDNDPCGCTEHVVKGKRAAGVCVD